MMLDLLKLTLRIHEEKGVSADDARAQAEELLKHPNEPCHLCGGPGYLMICYTCPGCGGTGKQVDNIHLLERHYDAKAPGPKHKGGQLF